MELRLLSESESELVNVSFRSVTIRGGRTDRLPCDRDQLCCCCFVVRCHAERKRTLRCFWVLQTYSFLQRFVHLSAAKGLHHKSGSHKNNERQRWRETERQRQRDTVDMRKEDRDKADQDRCVTKRHKGKTHKHLPL